MRFAHCSGEGCRDCDNFHIKFKPEIPDTVPFIINYMYTHEYRTAGRVITKGGKEHGDQQGKESN